MTEGLFRHKHIEMRKSPIHGYGVFATEDIAPGEILEEVPFLPVPNNVLSRYVFRYPRNNTPNAENVPVETVVASGFGSFYNHSNIPNASWSTDIKNKLFIFYTVSRISKNQEIRIYYGDENYWATYPDIQVK